MALREIKGVVDRVPWENVSPPPKIKEDKMTNREWLESLSDEELAKKIGKYNPCDMCIAQYGNCYMSCEHGTELWLKAEWNYPVKKKELTQAQLCEAFELKFGKRRAISLDEVREVAKEIFK